MPYLLSPLACENPILGPMMLDAHRDSCACLAVDTRLAQNSSVTDLCLFYSTPAPTPGGQFNRLQYSSCDDESPNNSYTHGFVFYTRALGILATKNMLWPSNVIGYRLGGCFSLS